MKARIACTALGQRIVLGVPSADGTRMTHQRDVTSDCLKAIIDKIGEGNAVIVSEDGVPCYEITVRRVNWPIP